MAKLSFTSLVVIMLAVGLYTAEGLDLWGSGKAVKKMRVTGTALRIYIGGKPSVAAGRVRRSTDDKPFINSLTVNSNINARFATTSIQSTMTNSASKNQEAKFIVQIPKTAFISNFTMLIDGILYVAEVKEKVEAQKDYDKAREQNQTAGLVSSDPAYATPERGMEFFSLSVNVRAQSSVEFVLTYLELIQRKLGVYEQRLSIRPQQIVQQLNVDVNVYEPQGIKFIDVTEPSGSSADAAVIAAITHASAEVKEVSYSPSANQQKDMDAKTGINGDLVVKYDIEHAYDAGLVQFENDYFVQFFSPSGDELVPLGKNVIFVIDISGSMSGDKMLQTRESIQVILGQLRAEDKFMLLLFDDEVEYWPSNQQLLQANGDNIQNGKNYAKANLDADGATNINSALIAACKILKTSGQAGANMIVFLTDGWPSAGETNRNSIIRNVAEESAGKVAIFSLGFGHDVDYDLLVGISYKTGGFAKTIYEGVDAKIQLESFFQEVNTPLAYNVEVVYETDEVDFSSLTKYKFPQYFDGSEIIVAGKRKPQASNVLNTKVTFETDQPMELSKSIDTSSPQEVPQEATATYQQGFLEKLYVYMKIKDLLAELIITEDKVKKENIESLALELALDYNLVTPLTSMVIVSTSTSTEVDTDYGNTYGQAGTASTTSLSWILHCALVVILTAQLLH